jgi:hypothetical protein
MSGSVHPPGAIGRRSRLRPIQRTSVDSPLARVFDAWGFRSLLVGHGLDASFAVVNYEQAVDPFLNTDRLSDTGRAMFMGGACAKAYGWSPRKA